MSYSILKDFSRKSGMEVEGQQLLTCVMSRQLTADAAARLLLRGRGVRVSGTDKPELLIPQHGAMSNEQPKKKRKMEAANNPAANPPVSATNYRWNDKNVFHAINEGRFPADKIFDRPHYFALLDKLPVTRGHSLLITKHPVATMFEDKMPPDALADAMIDLQVRGVGPAAVNHLHVQLQLNMCSDLVPLRRNIASNSATKAIIAWQQPCGPGQGHNVQ